MAKYHGKLGYSMTVEEEPGLSKEKVIERDAYGDILQDNRRWQEAEKLNDDLNISNRLSIVADSFTIDHTYALRYATIMGSKWKVNTVEINPPRLILYIGGLYNGPGPKDMERSEEDPS